jgi:hypothetical protein
MRCITLLRDKEKTGIHLFEESQLKKQDITTILQFALMDIETDIAGSLPVKYL